MFFSVAHVLCCLFFCHKSVTLRCYLLIEMVLGDLN